MAEDEGKSVSRFGVFLRLSLLVGVVIAGAAGGYLASRLLTAEAQPTKPAEEGAAPEESRDCTYYDFEPITVTLDTRQKDRYLRVTITLAIQSKGYKDAEKLVKKRKPVLKDKLVTYLSGLGLDDVGDARRLNKIRREILDSFNHELWPNDKPRIEQLLFKEFVLQ